MKNNIVGVGLLLGVGGMIVFSLLWGETTVEYQNDTPTTTVVETVEPDWASDPDARAAAEAVIRKKELEAELALLEGEIEERQSRVDEIEKELSQY